jgi:hypothetical protein
MTKIYRSDVRAVVHEAMSGLYAAGLLDAESMRGFDELCLTPRGAQDRLISMSIANLQLLARVAERSRIDSAPPEGSASPGNWRR